MIGQEAGHECVRYPTSAAAGRGPATGFSPSADYADRGYRAFSQPFDIASNDMGFEPDRRPVGRRVHRVAKGGRPVLHLGDQRVVF